MADLVMNDFEFDFQGWGEAEALGLGTFTLSEGGECVTNTSGDYARGGAIVGGGTSGGLSSGPHEWFKF